VTPAEAIRHATLGTKWDGQLWIVGGCVRDELLGLPKPPDIDIVLESDSGELAAYLFEKQVSTIAPVEYPRFGTALVLVEGAKVELATARSESYSSESRKPFVQPAALEEDALRRDFTVNTLLKNLHTGELRDPLGSGLSDLQSGILRTPLDPVKTFRDDPLRMLRAIRFKNRYRFNPALGLLEAVREEASRLRIVSAERIRDEVVNMLCHVSASESFSDLMECNLLEQFWPEFKEGVGVEQGGYHQKDVWGHTLDVVDQVVRNGNEISLLVVLGALFHDVAKPRTRKIEDVDRVRFIGHEVLGAEMTKQMLVRLRFPTDTVDAVAMLVRHHMRLGSAVPFTESAARRLRRDLGNLVEPLLELCEADARAIGRIEKPIDFARIRTVLEDSVRKTPAQQLRSPLSGDEVMSILQLEPGPQVGQWLSKLSDAVVEGEIAPGNKEEAIQWLLKMHATLHRNA
jgi:poly(A) polymerase